MAKRIGKRTLALPERPGVLACASVVGGKEGAGPLKKGFDEVSADSYFGQDSWEKAETTMLGRCLDHCLQKADGVKPDCILGGPISGSTAPAPPWRRASPSRHSCWMEAA